MFYCFPTARIYFFLIEYQEDSQLFYCLSEARAYPDSYRDLCRFATAVAQCVLYSVDQRLLAMGS